MSEILSPESSLALEIVSSHPDRVNDSAVKDQTPLLIPPGERLVSYANRIINSRSGGIVIVRKQLYWMEIRLGSL